MSLSENLYFSKDQLSKGEMKKSEVILHFLLPAHQQPTGAIDPGMLRSTTHRRARWSGTRIFSAISVYSFIYSLTKNTPGLLLGNIRLGAFSLTAWHPNWHPKPFTQVVIGLHQRTVKPTPRCLFSQNPWAGLGRWWSAGFYPTTFSTLDRRPRSTWEYTKNRQ